MRHIVVGSLTLALGALLLIGGMTGCSEDEELDLNEQEMDLFRSKLNETGSMSEACAELEVLCNTTGFGCKAHEVFCKVPTKEYICQQLAAACASYPAACDVYNSHCQDDPTKDGGPPLDDLSPVPDTYQLDRSIPTVDLSPGFDSCCWYADTGPNTEDASPRRDSAMNTPDARNGCSPDNPDTPLVNEDTCTYGQQCINGACLTCVPDNPNTPLVNEETCPAGQQCLAGVCSLCIPDDPNTPLVNEDNCPEEQQCINGECS